MTVRFRTPATRPVTFTFVAAALALAGCHASETTGNASDGNAVAAIENGATIESGPDAGATDAVEAVTPVSVPDVPTAPSTAPPADALPLTEASATAQAISRGVGITRVRRGDGWAWLQGREVVRTASLDGKRVSYFRSGQRDPYFVQMEKQSYGYARGRVAHSYGDDGIPRAPDADHARIGTQLADQARREHDTTARDIRDHQLHHDDGHVAMDRPATRPEPRATPMAPSPSPSRRSASDRHEAAPGSGPTPQPGRDRQDHHGGAGR